MHTLNSTHSPGIGARMLATLARLSQRVQNRVAKLIGFKDARTASAVVGVVGLTTMAVGSIIAGPVAPVLHTAGVATTVVGLGGLAGDALEREAATWDGGGKTVRH